jgi:hypothetical protein
MNRSYRSRPKSHRWFTTAKFESCAKRLEQLSQGIPTYSLLLQRNSICFLHLPLISVTSVSPSKEQAYCSTFPLTLPRLALFLFNFWHCSELVLVEVSPLSKEDEMDEPCPLPAQVTASCNMKTPVVKNKSFPAISEDFVPNLSRCNLISWGKDKIKTM